MNEQNDRKNLIHEFQPYLVRVIAPGNVSVSFSRFSVTEELYNKGILRGIANIDIDTGSAEINVYVKDGETVLKKLNADETDWDNIATEPTDFEPDKRGIWRGFLKATLNAGDPPIAVG